ncbi:hypothetical protein EMIT0P2_120082 [Pseudomonas sp. IT-P2]
MYERASDDTTVSLEQGSTFVRAIYAFLCSEYPDPDFGALKKDFHAQDPSGGQLPLDQ